MKFIRYHFRPGYVLITLQLLVVCLVVAAVLWIANFPKAAATFIALWLMFFVASTLGSYLRFTRYQSYKKG